MSFRGMDPDHVERVSQQLALQAELVSGVVGIVDTTIAVLTQVWMGEDVAAFHALWSATHRPAARSTAADLGGWATALKAQALQQEATSQGGTAVVGPSSASTIPSASSRRWVSDLAQLTSYAEHHGRLPRGFTVVDQEHRADGFDYYVFKDAATGRYLVVYPGTSSHRDWATDVLDGAGYSTKQYEEATRLALELNAKYPGQVTFTGHSLGGGLAIVSSLATGGQAVTFNSSAPQGRDLALATVVGPPDARAGNITNYVTPDDPLREDRLLGLPGRTVTLHPTDSLSLEARAAHMVESGPPSPVIPSPVSPLEQIGREMWYDVGHDHGMEHVEREVHDDDSTYWIGE